MKNFLTFVVEWKSAAALVFSASVVLSGAIMILNGMYTVPINMLISLLIVSMGGTFLQLLAFGERFIKNVRYPLRAIIFAVPFFALIKITARAFQLFALDNAMLWLWLSVIFLAVFIVWIVAFEIYFRIMGKRYDGLLGQYRRDRELGNKS